MFSENHRYVNTFQLTLLTQYNGEKISDNETFQSGEV